MSMMSILLGNGGKGRASISLTATGNNYDVYTNRGPSYVAGNSDITVTVPAPTIIGSSSTGAYAMLVPSSFNPADTITIVNDGVIQGAGGPGGNGGYSSAPSGGSPGNPGGNALYINRPTIITNNGTIAGGGGGGGGGIGSQVVGPGGISPKATPITTTYTGGGGGGGAGTIVGSGGSGANNGSPGTSSSGGSGGDQVGPGTSSGAPGGGRGAAGSNAPNTGGGNAGNYIVGNSFATWPATGTRQGGVA